MYSRRPLLGRRGRHPGTRELIHAPYAIVYRVNDEQRCIHIEAVFHGSRRYE
ncbi:MAG: type II toxin-antitoxin system RelE/ParE family toxin [Bryobacteraceae bacterium]